MVVMKCILEIVRSLLLRPSYFIQNLPVFILASFISFTVFNRWQDCLIKHQIYTMSFTYYAYLLKIDFARRPNVSGKSLRSCRKSMPSIAKVPMLERVSDIIHVSCHLSSELLGVFCIDPSMCAIQR